MYRVAICEDQQIFLNKHENVCRTILESLNIEYQISVFTSSTEFFAVFIAQQKPFDLILLDIVMDGMNGIELAQNIRQTDKGVEIIFITANPEFAMQGYDIRPLPLHFLLKPIDPKTLEQLITESYLRQLPEDIIIKSGEQHLQVLIKDILYLETQGRRVNLELRDDRSVSYSGKLTDILQELPDLHFIRCHKSYAVNINNIHKITRNTVVTSDRKYDIPVSRPYLDDVRSAFMRKLSAAPGGGSK